MAEGVGFEPTTPVSQGKRLAGARTRPLCDPSARCDLIYYAIYRVNQQTLAAVKTPSASIATPFSSKAITLLSRLQFDDIVCHRQLETRSAALCSWEPVP